MAHVPGDGDADTAGPSLLTVLQAGVVPATVAATDATPLPDDSQPVSLRREVWVIPVLVLAAMNVLAMLVFEAYVLIQTWRSAPARRHLLLGQLLLLALLLASATSVSYVLQPSALTCALARVGTGLAYTLMFATLLVKCVLLYSLNSGVYLPAGYQALLLISVVLTQLVLAAQWLAQQPPGAGAAGCATSFHTHLLTLLYSGGLLVAVTCAAIRGRRIRDNHGEAVSIGAAAALSVLVWCTWTVAGLVAERRHQDAALSLGLAVNATLVFLVMFLPKGRQLAALGRTDPADDRISLSYAEPGRYSPSFYHFRPVKVQPAEHFRRKHPPMHPNYYYPYLIPRCTGYIKQEDNLYNTIDHIKAQYCRGGGVTGAGSSGPLLHHHHPADPARTLSANNPNVFFYQRSHSSPHPGLMY